MKLFKVNLRGFQGKPLASVMVVAKDPTSAYQTVRIWLDEARIGLPGDRELKSLELIADTDGSDTTIFPLFITPQ